MIKFKPLPGFNLALIATIMAAIVVVLGAYTRLVDAGLGCPDWPTCYGHYWSPKSNIDIAIANEKFPDSPVDLDKTWPEMVHRYLASTLGLLIIGLVAIAIKHRHKKNQPVKLPMFLLAFVLLQGAFGAWTVTLKLLPQIVTAHLLGGFTTLTLLAILTLRLSGRCFDNFKRLSNLVYIKRLAAISLSAVVVQIFLGGWTTSNYAALACPDFPTCQTQWWPSVDFNSGFNFAHPIGPNYQGGQLDTPARTAIHIMHRIGAAIVSLCVASLIAVMYVLKLKRWAILLAALLTTQVFLGISNVVLGLPLIVAVLHNLCGALLLIALVIINSLSYRTKELSYV